MSQFIGLGDGRDGVIPNSGVINTYAAQTSSSASRDVTTLLSVSVGDYVWLHQTQSTTVHGQNEMVKVVTVGVGQFTADRDIVGTYSTGAQAIKVPQYLGGAPTGVLTCDAWNGSVGGLFAYASLGPVSGINGGSVNLTGKGFRGGTGGNDGSGTAGEGWRGTHGHGGITNDNGGGSPDANPGGGGANRTVGLRNGSGDPQNDAGFVAGSADGTLIDLGGGSGGSSTNSNPRDGVIGGGSALILGSIEELPLISDGTRGIDSLSDAASGGSAGGFFTNYGPTLHMGSSISHSNGKAGGTGTNAGASGGQGGEGGYALYGCEITGSTSPTAYESEGGHEFCSLAGGQII